MKEIKIENLLCAVIKDSNLSCFSNTCQAKDKIQEEVWKKVISQTFILMKTIRKHPMANVHAKKY